MNYLNSTFSGKFQAILFVQNIQTILEFKEIVQILSDHLKHSGVIFSEHSILFSLIEASSRIKKDSQFFANIFNSVENSVLSILKEYSIAPVASQFYLNSFFPFSSASEFGNPEKFEQFFKKNQWGGVVFYFSEKFPTDFLQLLGKNVENQSEIIENNQNEVFSFDFHSIANESTWETLFYLAIEFLTGYIGGFSSVDFNLRGKFTYLNSSFLVDFIFMNFMIFRI